MSAGHPVDTERRRAGHPERCPALLRPTADEDYSSPTAASAALSWAAKSFASLAESAACFLIAAALAAACAAANRSALLKREGRGPFRIPQIHAGPVAVS